MQSAPNHAVYLKGARGGGWVGKGGGVCGGEQGWGKRQEKAGTGHLVYERYLVGFEVAGILVVLIQQSHSRTGPAIQELYIQHLQLIHSDVKGFMKAHSIHWNDLQHDVTRFVLQCKLKAAPPSNPSGLTRFNTLCHSPHMVLSQCLWDCMSEVFTSSTP